MIDLVITIGCSGAGKSTWVNKNKSAKDIVVSPDQERRLLGSVNDQSFSKQAFENCYKKLSEIKDGKVFFDATSLRIKALNDIVKIIPNANITLVTFEDSRNADLCLGRIKKDITNKVDRSNTPDYVVKTMSDRYSEFVDSKEFANWVKSHKAKIVKV